MLRPSRLRQSEVLWRKRGGCKANPSALTCARAYKLGARLRPAGVKCDPPDTFLGSHIRPGPMQIGRIAAAPDRSHQILASERPEPGWQQPPVLVLLPVFPGDFQIMVGVWCMCLIFGKFIACAQLPEKHPRTAWTLPTPAAQAPVLTGRPLDSRPPAHSPKRCRIGTHLNVLARLGSALARQELRHTDILEKRSRKLRDCLSHRNR